jgi:predicted Zn finger-like uncharacterized protein
LIIRCERCSTTYELDDAVLDPGGSEVECSRCHHLFTVHPPAAAGRTMVGIPAAEPARAPEPPATRPEPPAELPTGLEQRVAAQEPPAALSRQVVKVTPARTGPSIYRPAGAQPAAARAPILRRDTVGAFESRLRWSHRWRWLAPVLVVLLAAAGAGAWYLRRARPAVDADKAHAHALELALRDDVTSLEEAGAVLDGALRVAPALHTARADRALLDLLLAGALAAGAPGQEPPEKGRALVARATETLDQLEKEGVAVREVARARVVAAALGQDRATVARLATAARAQLADDVQVELAERAAEVRAADRGVRDRAVGALGMLAARRPELLRARYLLARGQGLAGRKAEAQATVEGLLRSNPRHEGGAALKAELAAAAPKPAAPAAASAAPAPVLAAPAAPAPTPAAPAAAAGAAPRKPAPQAEASAAARGTPVPAPAAVPAVPRTAPAAPTPAGGAAEGAADSEGAGAPSRLRPAAVPDPEPVLGGG